MLRNTIKIPIEVTKGTDAISFEFTVRDYNLPATAAAVAYAYRMGMKRPNSTLCDVSGNVISFQPSANFFEVGNNELQIRVINEDKSLISFKEKVKCSDSMGFPDEEEEADKSLIEQIIAQSGKESGERKAADEKERSERKTADETEKSERIAADAKEKSERQKEIATERARIDQLTKMGEGSTTGDAELADIRAGNEGATYSNAGNAVRAQTKDVPVMMDNLQSPYVDISLLEQGSINSAVGSEIASSKVLRSVEFHWNKNGKITAPAGYKIAIANYAMQPEESGQMTKVYMSFENYSDSQTSSKADGDAESRRLLIKRSDGADINAEDLRGKITTNVPGLRAMDVIENLEKKIKTDTTLEKEGVAADAAETGKRISQVEGDIGSLKEDLTNNIDAVYSGTEDLKSEIEWFYGAYYNGYFHDNISGNEVISEPFIPNNLLKLVVRKISDNVDYQIGVCESTYNENDKIVFEGSTNINVLNNTASVGEEGNYEFTTGKTYSIRLLKSPNSSIIVTDKTALNYFSIDLIGNGINKNTENITEIEDRLVELENKPVNLLPDCSNKKIVLFGDSLFACSNDGGAWGGVLQKHFGFGRYISVGIGGSKFIANGKVALPSDFSVGNSLPKTLVVTSDGTTPCAFSDWTRIDATVPSDADIIIVGTGANDCGYGEYWIKEDSVDMPGFVIDGSIEKTPHTGWDTAWQNSDEYVNYNGDWDRSFLGGAIRSTIMKLQAKAPNAKIFVTNWCNSRGTAGQIGTSTHDAKNTENTLSIMKKICNDFGVELIDLFSDSGINPLNRLQYVKDSIHLTDDGYRKMMAQPIVSAVRNYIMSAYN